MVSGLAVGSRFYNLALNAAEQELDAGTAAMLISIGPALIALLAGGLLGEGFPRPLIVGCAVALAGAVMIGAATSQGDVAIGSGVALCLVAALSRAGGVVAQKPALARASALQVHAVGVLHRRRRLSAVRAGACARAGRRGRRHRRVGVVPRRLPDRRRVPRPGRMRSRARRSVDTGVTTYLVPPLAIVMGWAILGETPPVLALLGGALCVTGAAVAHRRPKLV